MTPVRARACSILSGWTGLSSDPANPAKRKVYLDLVAPNEAKDVREFLGRPSDPRASGCGLVISALYRALGIRHPKIDTPLVPGYAIERNFQMAREAGAVVPWKSSGPRPQPGDAVYLFMRRGQVTSQHIYAPIALPDTAGRMRAVDGGQVTPTGYQLIDVRTHQITASGVDLPSGRPVIQWIDLDVLTAKLGWCPEATTVPAPSNVRTEGIDVSANNGPIVWPRVRTDGVQFAYLRGMIGRDDVDKRVEEYASACRALGIPFGLYGVSWPRHDRAQDTDVQARQLLDLATKLGATLDPMVDVEVRAGCTDSEIQAAARLYHETLGPRSIHYTCPAFQPIWDPWFGARRLWIAHYAPESPGMPQIPAPWSRPLLWQYAASKGVIGQVNGISGAVDRNRLYGPLEELIAAR